MDSLAQQIVESLTHDNRSRVAVVEFPDLNGGVSQFGEYVAEELTTRLFMTARFEVVERRLLDKVLAEHRLASTGVIDPDAAKELGRMLGLDAIATGTLAELGGEIRVNARVISTETGRALGAARVAIRKSAAISALLAKPAKRQAPTTSSGDARPPSGDVFFENFADAREGEVPRGWIGGDHLAVIKRSRHAELAPFEGSEYYRVSSPEIELPKDFVVAWTLRFGRIRAAFTVEVGEVRAVLDVGDRKTTTSLGASKGSEANMTGTTSIIEIRKQGDVFRLLVDGRQVALSRRRNFMAPSRVSLGVKSRGYRSNWGNRQPSQIDFAVRSLRVREH